MGTIKAHEVIARAQQVLQDTSGVRWPVEHELLTWLNDGQREVVMLKPNAYVVSRSVALRPGTRQDLPADCLQLLYVVRNMGERGNTPGRAIRLAMREMLDAQMPNWHTARPAAEVKHYIYSPLDSKHYYVYPPQPELQGGVAHYVEAVYSVTPPDVKLQERIALDDVYQGMLVDYILYRAYSKDAEHASDQGRAEAHRNAFVQALTAKAAAEVGANPARNLKPIN